MPPASSPAVDLPQQAADVMLQAFGNHPGFRLAHAKGIVCHGTFEPNPQAAEICKAAHFRSGTIPVIARFSDATGVPVIPDNDPNSNPKGLAIRFQLPGGKFTDIVANGTNGFPVGTAVDFVALVGAIVATRPDSPHPTPIEQFLGSHPASFKIISQPNPTPVSFATAGYFGNNSFIFVNESGRKVATRYQIVPVGGTEYLTAPVAALKTPNFLFDEIKVRLAKFPTAFRLVVQVASPGDPTHDATQVWPENRKKVGLGTIRLASVDPKSSETERFLDPTHLIDGIELSDDPLPEFRRDVYSISIKRRTGG